MFLTFMIQHIYVDKFKGRPRPAASDQNPTSFVGSFRYACRSKLDCILVVTLNR